MKAREEAFVPLGFRRHKKQNAHQWFFDIETTTETIGNNRHIRFMQSIACKCALSVKEGIIKQKWVTCHNQQEFNNWAHGIINEKGNSTLMAHNAGFDVQYSGLLELLLKAGFEVVTPAIQVGTFVLVLKRDKKVIKIIDSMNWFTTSLAKVGKAIGVEKLPMPPNDADKQTWDEYNKRDVFIMMKAMLQWLKFMNDICGQNFNVTRAGDAMTMWALSKGSRPLFPHNHKRLNAIENDAYYGGRVEYYRIGKIDEGTLFKVDVNSMYPYVMANNQYPYIFQGSIDNPDREAAKRQSAKAEVLIQAWIDIDKPYAPARYGGNILFPIGRFNGSWCGNEARYILNHAKDIHIKRLFYYKRDDYFSGFINRMYESKIQADKDGNQVKRMNVKLAMNSLYGKFAQLNQHWAPVCTTEQYDISSAECHIGKPVKHHRMTHLGHTLYESYVDGFSKRALPIIASCVTANARMYLWELMQTAGHENTYYCDTDSLVVNQTGYDRLESYMDKYRLGALAVENISDTMTIHAKKDYEIGNEVKRKGIPKKATPLGDGVMEFESIRSLNHHIRYGNTVKGDIITITRSRKSLPKLGLVYNDRHYQPWVLDEKIKEG